MNVELRAEATPIGHVPADPSNSLALEPASRDWSALDLMEGAKDAACLADVLDRRMKEAVGCGV